eukprot:GFUD01020649.1.p1 GENE.GFUD01020649.1~~GFUD01020649.1.p1  ORF type:complete len:464 (+),score=152.03 GFUD01020649.1:72-1463(+)
MCSTTTLLPRELWLSIMSHLPPADLLALTTTCKLFNYLANDVLRTVKLPIHRRLVYKLGLVSLVRQARLVKAGLDLSEECGTSDRSPGLFSRDCLRRFLNTNQQKLLFKSNEEMKEFFFNMSNMRLKANLGMKSYDVLDCLFSYLASNPFTLKALDCEGGNLSHCDPDLVAQAVSGVLIANLERVWLPTSHLNKIFHMVGQGGAFLQYLSLVEEDLSLVDKNILAQSLVKLKEVDLGGTKLSKEQLDTLLESIANTTPLHLTSLGMYSLSSLAFVSSSLISRSLSRLARADLHWTNLTSTQLVHLSTTIVHSSSSSLYSLSLAGVKLSTLPPSLLANLLTKLTVADLSYTDLTPQQSLAMLSTLATGNTSMQSLALDCSCVEEVSEQVVVGLCNAVSRLVFIGGGWDRAGGKAGVVYDSLLHSKTMVDCSVMCCGIANSTMSDKYPSADLLLNNRTRGVFLNR